MTLKELLDKNPLITMAELGRLMYPDVKTYRSRLNNKLNGNTGQRITPKDVELAKEALTKHIKDLKTDLLELKPNEK